MSITADALIQHIETLLASTAPLDDRIKSLQSYSKEFDAWYASFCASHSAEQNTSADRLSGLHNELINAANGWLKDTGQALGAHKKKGKAIMAYADVLPKKISRYRPKKG